MEVGETRRTHRQQNDGRWQWSESRKLPGDPQPASGRYMEAKLVIQTAAPGYEDEIFEDAAARSISFQPDESRTESGKQTHYGRCGLRGETDRRWFSMYVTKFSDGSSETQTYYYDTVGTSK